MGKRGFGRPVKVSAKEKAQIEALWAEAEGRKPSVMKQPIGFSGGGLWALSAFIAGGVVWIQANWGPNAAGIAVIIVGTIAVLFFWDMLGLAKRQADGNMRVAEKQVDANVRKEEIKGENMERKIEAQMRLKEHIFLITTIAKMMGARNPVQTTQAAAQEEDPVEAEMKAIQQIQWSHNDL